MNCDEIRDHLIELIYDEGGDSPDSIEAQEHLRICPACRKELEELRNTRKYLKLWKDEAPPRNVAMAGYAPASSREFPWKYLRYAAIAAMLVICFLALANTRISWNREGFSFSTGLFKEQEPARDYYTKSEVEAIMNDSEIRISETSRLMILKMLDTVEQDRWMDLQYVRSNRSLIQNGN
ncbi:MAG: hypothetical protein JXA73_24910 [Acidobacteria bacterium]|nr:hypothetical protein [Acidobacteriota bacterium]